MNRRTVLAIGGTAVVGTVAGCLGDEQADRSESTADATARGYGPEPETAPEERSIDTSTYETADFEGIDVPLAPIDDVFYWYQRQEARVVDARGSDQYQAQHIAGAPLSPAADGYDTNDPIAAWDTDERIVTYCGCPHHLSGLRAASLIDDGYESVYALDEGFTEWVDRGYPLEGEDVSAERSTYRIRGQSSPDYAGELVMLDQVDADRREATPIDDDGSYTLQLHYAGSIDSRFTIEAPDYTVEGTLDELTSDTIVA